VLAYLKKVVHAWNSKDRHSGASGYEEDPPLALSGELTDNVNTCKAILGSANMDVIIREFSFGREQRFRCALIYINGMVNITVVNQHIVQPLLYGDPSALAAAGASPVEWMKAAMLSVGYLKEVAHMDEVVDECLAGNTVLLLQDEKRALVVGTQGWEERSIQEPLTEAVVRGPHEGFTESLGTNITMLRRKIRHPNLTLESMKIGRYTKTAVCVVYLKGVVNPKLIEEVRLRLKRIKIDGIFESGYIEQLIEDAPYSPFATIDNSERPDVVAAKILEGRAAIFIDGTPFALTLPMLFIEGFQSPEDYYTRPYYASLIRLVRFLSFIIAISGPAIYVALTNFHQELIPTPLLISIARAKEGTPFPSLVEALGMGVVFEIIREAGVRLPRPIGQTISIVGALVIGQAAVSAGLIGAPVVIMVAVTSICSFVAVSLNEAGAVIRLTALLLAAFLGGFGLVSGFLLLLIHLAAIRSFGVPYLSPAAPLNIRDLKDSLIRAPLWLMHTRPRMTGGYNLRRMSPETGPPSPPAEERQK
jgi:spore germination protein KA